MDLNGKVAVITGGAQGIGQGIVRRYIEEKAKVAIFDCDEAMMSETKKEMECLGGQVRTYDVDVTSSDQVQKAVDDVVNAWERIDVLAACAGICWPATPFLNLSEEDWDRVLAVNLKGYFLVSKSVAKAMVEQGQGGSIIHMSSVNGLSAEAEIAHYNVSKGGINMLTKSMALELAKYGIRVNAILPGFIDTRLNRGDINNAEWLEEYLKTIPLGRVGMPADIAAAAFFLASDDSAYVTGDLLIVDGGQVIKLS